MAVYRLMTSLWLIGLNWNSFIHADCPYAECECYKPDIMCVYKGLTSMPTIINENTEGFTMFTLEGNPITAIPSGSLPSNLTEIDFIDNPLITIDTAALDGSATTLTSLIISNARLSRVPDALLHLRNLQQMHIERVPILDWNENAMKNIGSTLKILYLENVDLTRPPGWLEYFSGLTELSILGSYLSELPDNALDGLANSLTTLNLYNNSLTEVPKALSKLISLRILYLSNNRIVYTSWLPRLNKLASISLEGNRISNASQLSLSLRPFADSLRNLEIQNNELTAIPELSFLGHIEDLNFMNNKISDSNSGSLPPGLNSLDLEHNLLPRIPHIVSVLNITDITIPFNAIRDIQGTDFPATTQFVELGFNLITQITDTSFPEHSVINAIYLNNNPISVVNNLAFKNLPELRELSLQNTKLTRLPLALSSLARLYSFDISRTPGLVCTCLEKSLAPWVLGLSPENVPGDCGQMTIYQFFATLSPDCPE